MEHAKYWTLGFRIFTYLACIVCFSGCATAPYQTIPVAGIPKPPAIPPEKIRLYEKNLFVWPFRGKIISWFGQKSYGTRNKGIDIETPRGFKITAAKNGRVVFCSDTVKGLGKVIIIDHLDGFSTVYARNSQNLSKVGEYVNQNQVIALAGSTGRGSASYLHFEIRKQGKPQNPLYYLP